MECWKEDWLTGKSVVVFTVAWMLLGAVYTLRMRKRAPVLFAKKAQKLREA